ncbi:rho guanine nucleotide exchange factor at 64C isoform X2 [Rhodnius prolixus]|uniref:rho guanine nucleotide exchange factor at 64C isoform X2 n=1 Tax=Rhodnius prolixus TaxID=13249 RepID=UPI003D18850E
MLNIINAWFKDSSTESTGSGRFHRSLSERLCSDGIIPGTKELAEERVPAGFNDTIRLRQRAPRRDSRTTFGDQCSSGSSTPRRGLSPGRPRPREPPPPPPPPQPSAIKPPPAPPPRQIFPFTKEQIRKLNENRPAEYVPTKILTLEQPQYENRIECEELTQSESAVTLDETKKLDDELPSVEKTKTNDIHPITASVSEEKAITSDENELKNRPNKVPDVTEVKEEVKVKLTIPAQDDYQENKTIVSIDTPPSEQNYGVIVELPNISVTSVNIEPEIISGNKVTININSVPEQEYVSQVIVVGTDVSSQTVSKAQEEIEELIRSRIDPVEAARANLIPHICGRDPATESDMSSDSYKSALDSFASEPPYPEKDKLVDEVEVQLGIDFDSDESHYETIRDPIYEEIGEASETPPPLPTSPPPALVEPVDELIPTKSIFEGATKYDILSYLVGAKRRGIVAEDELSSPGHSRISSLDLSSQISQLSAASDSSEDSCPLILPPTDISFINEKLRKSSAEVERNDSGVGSETSRSRWQHLSSVRQDAQHTCEDCDQHVETQVTDSGVMFAPLVCRKCSKRRSERREIITEIVETEEKYGRDLRIILEEFYRPMKVAGLLSTDQLLAIFLNTEELLEHNTTLAEKLRDALEIAIEQGDEDLLTVNIGALFLEATPMLHAFESYCTRQGAASMLLTNLEKEKELLRIFLRVSQMENSVLRRMNLNSFLMVPVQRITKYPLLLSRLYKVSPSHVIGKEAIKEAQHNIELHLEHINYLAKDISTNKLWRRISVTNGRRYSSEMDMVNIKLRKIAVDVLEWTHDEVRFAMEGKLLFTQPTDTNWRKRATIKLSPINAVLVTLGKPTEDYQPDSEDTLVFPRTNGIRDATIVLMKEKGGRYTLLREPLYLDRCIVCAEADIEDYFEIQELPTKDTYIFKAEDGELTKRWYRQIQYHAQGLGSWRKRRNALANIMINGMQLRT